MSAKRRQKMQQERWEKSLFLNLFCCCLETSLNRFIFFPSGFAKQLGVNELICDGITLIISIGL
jgi:hypothetical protein